MLWKTPARICAITAPMKYNTRPLAAAIPMAGSPTTHRKLGMQFAEAGYLTLNLDYCHLELVFNAGW